MPPGKQDNFLRICIMHKIFNSVLIDLSSSSKKGGLAHIPINTIGFGVRYTVNLLLNNYLK